MSKDKAFIRFLQEYCEEFSDNTNVMFYTNLDNFGFPELPKMKTVLKKISDLGFIARRTVFQNKSIRTNATIADIKEIIGSLLLESKEKSNNNNS